MAKATEGRTVDKADSRRISKNHGDCYDEDTKTIVGGGGSRAELYLANKRQKDRKTKARSTADTAICIHI
jgi:hypothetical protein